MVGYNVQMAVDAKHHLIVAHEVTNIGNDRAQLSSMARAARDAMGKTRLKAIADRGYFSAQEIRACADTGIAAILPKPTTSSAKAGGRFDRADFIYIARDDEYQCPAGERAIYRFTREEHGLQLRRYWSSACPQCTMRSQCTPSPYRRISRWEHEAVLEAVQPPARQDAGCNEGSQANRRACLRNLQALDGLHALLDAHATECRN